jgi:hypothetical protein
VTPGSMADAFTQWAKQEGLLPRITEDQCADLARAFMAGCAYAIRSGGVQPLPAVSPAPERARCSACRYRWRLRKDGTVQHHQLYIGDELHECAGSGKPPGAEL